MYVALLRRVAPPAAHVPTPPPTLLQTPAAVPALASAPSSASVSAFARTSGDLVMPLKGADDALLWEPLLASLHSIKGEQGRLKI